MQKLWRNSFTTNKYFNYMRCLAPWNSLSKSLKYTRIGHSNALLGTSVTNKSRPEELFPVHRVYQMQD
jgi:hypothetical protein